MMIEIIHADAVNPYTMVHQQLREIARLINPNVDVSKIDLKVGPKPWDMSSNIAFILAQELK